MDKILENNGERIIDIVGVQDPIKWEGWEFSDLKNLKEVAIKKRIHGREVAYNMVKKKIFIERLEFCKLYEFADILNTIREESY